MFGVRRPVFTFFGLFFTAAFLLAAMYAAPSALSQTEGQSQSALISPNPPLSNFENEWFGLVGVHVGNLHCSGSLINNSWVITAAHCIGDAGSGPHQLGGLMPHIIVTAQWRAPQARNAAGVRWYAPQRDLALIQVEEPFWHLDSLRNYARTLSHTPPSVGEPLKVFGKGLSEGPNQSAQDDGKYRWLDVSPFAIEGERLQFLQSHAQPGDSGGPILINQTLYGVTRTQSDAQTVFAVASDIEGVTAQPRLPEPPTMRRVVDRSRVIFIDPTLKVGRDTVAVDHCSVFGSYCGASAARHFCMRQNQNFTDNVSFTVHDWAHTVIISHVDTSEPKFCYGPSCVAFKSVTCHLPLSRPILPDPSDLPTVRDTSPQRFGNPVLRPPEIPDNRPQPFESQIQPPGYSLTPSMRLEDGVNRVGGDSRDFPIFDGGLEVCFNACLSESQCKAFTYVRPQSSQDGGGHCWLKDQVRPPTQDTCCISGVVRPGSTS